MMELASLAIGYVIKAVKDHALAGAEEQAKIEAAMLSAVQAMVVDRGETMDAHDLRLADTLKAIEDARAALPPALDEDTQP